MNERISFGIVGAGWRARFFLRIAHLLPDRFETLGVVTRNPERAKAVSREFAVNVHGSTEAMLGATSPMFVVTSVPREANPQVVRQAIDAGVPVLSETPPAADVEQMCRLCELVDKGAVIQVAEQYHLQPHHAARLALVGSGKLGAVSHAQVSVCHGYHGISLIRSYLGIGCEDAVISGQQFTAPIVEGPGRDGPPPTETIVDSEQAIITFDFGDKLGIYDFCGDQYFSHIRAQRLLVRGERGEIVDHDAVYLEDHVTPVHVSLRRHEAGPNGNLEGNYLKGIQVGEDWLYKNPLAPAPLSDDEIAVGDTMLKMARSVETAEPFYTLAEACQDTYLDLTSQQAAKSGKPVKTTRQPWAW